MNIFYNYWLANIPGIGNKKIQEILKYTKDAKTVYNLSKKQLKEFEFLTVKNIQMILEAQNDYQIKEQFENMQKKGVAFVCELEEEYPDKLRNLVDAPFGLYIKGRLPSEIKPSVAIIGARRCSPYGREVARKFGEEFAQYGIQIISGLARGIDGIGQMSAVEAGGESFGVLGCGVDICYPRENIELYMQIQKKGGLLSEYPIGTQPRANLFPYRNRLISGLADVLLIIEAKVKSGTFITVEYALEQGKDVFVVPGRINDALSQGCNELIKQGAGIVTSFQDILDVFGVKSEKKCLENIKNQLNTNLALEKKQLIVYSCLSLEPKSIETIIQEVNLSIPELTNIIVTLQMMGLIYEPARNYYVRTSIKEG
ncbi:DNA-processing protein DprA [Anaerosacchariphilus polymeriproducens]|uniref:DNA-protecting protein DprA n=1 Tax=Anaerosacchariphilus polymeriproducens TaxID=1812858 RepID=A0A371ASB6_9FIRM|nr:DNA-processing protein DprA [Anaerosacchariphilus polymeriproducens]RDU22442.1 DNA-protecting protein DprA [Anaerosacchariphilus polymeriproducens]